MKIWIDLDNSPHVHFFAPIIQELKRNGVEVILTARDFAQTIELAQFYGLKHSVVGSHKTPHTTVGRVLGTLLRVGELLRHLAGKRPAIAVGHGSRAQVIAAALLGVPVATIYDYEHVAASVFLRFCDRIMVPSLILPEELAPPKHQHKLMRYPGFKEEVYIYDFQPDIEVISNLGLDVQRPIVTVRPPATWAHYHNAHSKILFRALAERLRQQKDVQVVVLARTHDQAEDLRREYNMDAAPFLIPKVAVDALSLMWYSDAVFSGGGTMVREAALLGVDAFSTFAGKLGAADAALIERGRLKMVYQPEDLDSFVARKRPRPDFKKDTARPTRDFIYNTILEFAGWRIENKNAATAAKIGS